MTRQHYCYSGEYMVEIAYGGLNYANADALVERYPGEFEEFTNPVEAVEKAIEIHKAWKKDDPELDIQIGMGTTLGYCMEFEGSDYEFLRNQAQELYTKLPKCSYCNEPIDPDEYYYCEALEDEKFCSKYCLNHALALILESDEH